ncbi:hypothetical protein [Hahella ganghwensis]|uniref:hypothetical protein n=1 Tax=Hahella ganghwensis TaxID=286420 RepID=UPI00037CFE25|nr:hypothetical protein [Hahella ganghwensis]
MGLKAGERLKGMRELMGFTRMRFAEFLDINLIRLKNLEQLKARVAEDEFEKLGKMFPEMMPWLVYGGKISLSELERSDNEYCQLIALKIKIGEIPAGYGFRDAIEVQDKNEPLNGNR